jgi:hypothetical protein
MKGTETKRRKGGGLFEKNYHIDNYLDIKMISFLIDEAAAGVKFGSPRRKNRGHGAFCL